jgi:hypothetical protein
LSARHPALECGGLSNISLQTAGGGLLSLVGGASVPGLGAVGSGTCGAVDIHNGSVAASGATGIGSVVNVSSVSALRVFGGNVSAQGLSGAGIGSGESRSHVARE